MIVFDNEGELDTRAITTFGVSSKENESAIGYFGTGLKYAIAIILRNGGSVDLHTGGRFFTFEVEREKIRVDEFDTVFMVEHVHDERIRTRLGFTTELGKTWELWQAYRELYCNTLDEGGEVYEASRVNATSSRTTFIVTGPAFEMVHRDREAFILDRTDKPQSSHTIGDVYPSGGGGKSLFYRSMKAMQSDRPFLKTWNLLQTIELTEDRTIKWDFQALRRMCDMVAQSTDPKFIREIIMCGDDYTEGKMDFSSSSVTTQEFRDTVRKCAEEAPAQVNGTAMALAKVSMGDLLPKKSVPMDEVDVERMRKACDFCESIGFPVREYPIMVMDHIEVGVHGLAHNNTIYIARACFQSGTKYLASTLIEEFIHLRFHHRDLTRELQTFLFDQVIGLGERLTGEPL